MIRGGVVVAVFLAGLIAAGCSRQERAPEARVTGFQPDGSYILNESERTYTCSRMAGTLNLHLADMKTHAARQRDTRQGIPRTVVSLLRRAAPVVERRQTEHMQRYQRDYAIVVALNKAMKEKGCTPIDVRSEVEDDARLMGISLRKLKR